MSNIDPSSDTIRSSPDGDDAITTGSGSNTPLGKGTVLADRYRLGRLLGKGGMGSVWEAEHISLGHSVAVKLIKPELAGNESSRSRFLQEARSAAALRSPYVVQIFDYGVEAGIPYIAMERLDGESLAERLRRVERLSSRQLVALMGQVARAVDKAHAAGIVHRDLKPDNIFIVSDDDGERCKVLDFGIAKVLSDGTDARANTQSGALLGTPYYMSPEQAINSSEVGPSADLWSMAVIAYECLLGERPFDGATLPAISVKLLAEPVPVPSEHGEVPPGFDAWFAQATQRVPSSRYGSARELAIELAIAVDVDAPSVSQMIPPATPPRRSTTWTILAGVVAAGAVGGWVIHDRNDGRVPTPTTSPPAQTQPSTAAAPTSVERAQPVAIEPGPATVPPAPESIVLSLEGPAGAQIYRGDTVLATLPSTVQLPRQEAPVVLRVVAKGFEDLEVRVMPSTDRQITLDMKTRRKTPAGPSERGEPSTDKTNVDDLEF